MCNILSKLSVLFKHLGCLLDGWARFNVPLDMICLTRRMLYKTPTNSLFFIYVLLLLLACIMSCLLINNHLNSLIGVIHVNSVYCVAVCITGRTESLKACDSSSSVQQLCWTHAKNRPIEHWLTFLQKLEEAGMKPSSQLIMKINAWMKLWMKAAYRSLVNVGEQCATAGCCQQSFGNRALCWSCLHAEPARSQKCHTSGCHNVSLTRSGSCLVCCIIASDSCYSVIASLAARQLDKQSISCMNRDCIEYLPGATEFCSECLLQLCSEARTSGPCKTVRHRKVHDGEHQDLDDSNERDHSAEHTSQMTTVYPFKSRRSLFGSELSTSSRNVGNAGQSTQPVSSTACIGPVCVNEGLDKYEGLCAACYTVLFTVNSQQHQLSTGYGL